MDDEGSIAGLIVSDLPGSIAIRRREAVLALAALGHKKRLDLFLAIAQVGRRGMSSGAVVKVMRLPITTISFHLGQLHKAGLIERRRHGRYLNYTVNRRKIDQLALFLQARGKDADL
jgi:ArsR family transcriptional regulator